MIVVAANPYSGAADNAARIAALERELRALGVDCRVVWEARRRTAMLADTTFMRGCRAVVAAGGDGTVAQVLNELPPGLALAVLPAGTENLFAAAFGFTRDPAALARALVACRTRPLDVGRASAPGRTRLFALMLSAGFDAEVVRRLGEWRAAGAVALRRVTRASYVAPLAAALLAYRHPPLRLSAGSVRVDGAHCVIANVPAYALDLPLVPGARADDGALDWVVFQRGGLAALATYSWATWRGRHLERDDVRAGRASRLTLDAAAAVPVQVDGDPWGTTPVEIETVPGGLTLLAVN
ncbi:MAG TPA: diacylglycerol kinase family protein [Methylomirabilota bacterium]|jgi:diacylglycerol kinase family enzyme|nr:diacylglycerol kinase family protein [Methylomirabilota bacterium]